MKPYSTVVITFFLKGQLMGLYGSSGPSKSTRTSAVVFTCDRGWSKTARLCVKLCMRDILPLLVALYAVVLSPPWISSAVSAFSRFEGLSGLELWLVPPASWRPDWLVIWRCKRPAGICAGESKKADMAHVTMDWGGFRCTCRKTVGA